MESNLGKDHTLYMSFQIPKSTHIHKCLFELPSRPSEFTIHRTAVFRFASLCVQVF